MNNKRSNLYKIKTLNKYEICIKCRKNAVKKVSTEFDNLPLCLECQMEVRTKRRYHNK